MPTYSPHSAMPRHQEPTNDPEGPREGPSTTSGPASLRGAPVECDGEWIATLIDSPSGRYLAPPVVFDLSGKIVMGFEVLAAVAESGIEIAHPVLHDYTPGDLSALEQKLAGIADQLGVPLTSP